MSDFDNYIKKLLDDINSSEDFLSQSPFRQLDPLKTDIPSRIFNAVSKYYYFFSKNKKVKKYFFNDIKFLNRQIRETEGSSRGYCLNALRRRKIIAFDYIYHTDGSAGKNLKKDPYQINQSKYYFRKPFKTSSNSKKKLLEP